MEGYKKNNKLVLFILRKCFKQMINEAKMSFRIISKVQQRELILQ